MITIEGRGQFDRNKQQIDKESAEIQRKERPVLVGGRYLGRELQMFPLENLRATQLGSGAYIEVFFETESGNIYRAYAIGQRGLAIVDGNSNAGRQDELRGTVLSSSDLKHALLTVGKRFAFGVGSSTSKIVRITAVTGKQFITTEPDEVTASLIAKRETNGNISDIRERFERKLKSR